MDKSLSKMAEEFANFMQEIRLLRKEIQKAKARLKKLEKHKISDPVDFYDFSNLKRRK